MLDHQPIETYLKHLPFLRVSSQIKTGFTGRVVGWNVAAPSCIRKRQTVEKMQQQIAEDELPLIVQDDTGDRHNIFRVMIKL